MSEELARVQQAWRGQVVAEYRSAAITAELLHWLIVLGISPDLIELCRRIVDDELAHAADARVVYLEAGGDPEAIPIEQDSLWNPHARGQAVHERALATAGRVFCCGETVAVPLFLALAEKTEQPSAVAMYARVHRDEPVHSAFGWALLETLLGLLGPEALAYVQAGAAHWIDSTGAYYTDHGDAPPTPLEERWGLMSGARYEATVRAALAQRVRPRFEKLGVVFDPA